MQQWFDEALLVQPKVITPERLARMVPQCHEPEVWATAFADHLNVSGIESDHDIAMFLAQVGHESASFRELEESMNYGVEALGKLFGAHRITPDEIQRYGRKQGQPANERALANALYGGAWGKKNLGNRNPQDGWNYRGRGLIQLTGRGNFEACAADTGLNIVEDPGLLERSPDAAVIAALWFWNERVSGRDIKTTTRQINGGYHGLADRVERFKRALNVLEAI